jgi:phosphatidylglycerol:prolipoprotein diacylglycerol transferase
MLDVASPAAARYGIGRIGCLISGDGDYGMPTSPGMSFPNGLVPTTGASITPIYELLAALSSLTSCGGSRPTSCAERARRTVFACYLMLSGLLIST